MNFLFPEFLIGLVAISIPIIIHLFNFRKYKKVYFTNVQFLKELKQESDSKSKLKELLILASRILAITSLVIAFAQPYILNDVKIKKGEKAISIYIDNSFSMESENKKGTLLENAKKLATEIASTLKESDKLQIITNDFKGQHQRLLSKEEFTEQLNDIKITSATKNISDVINRQIDFLNNNSTKNKQIYILSDFQKNTSELSKKKNDTLIPITLIPLNASQQNNVYIDSVWFDSPIQQYESNQKAHALIVNKSNNHIESGNIKLFINNTQTALSSFNIAANEKKEVVISFKIKHKGNNNCKLKIEDYPITFDDEYFFNFNSHNNISVLLINGVNTKTAANFKSLLQTDSIFNFKEYSESNIDYSAFKTTQLIILNELQSISTGLLSELQKFISKGGNAIVFPSQNADIKSYNIAFQTLEIPQIIALDTTDYKTQTINFEQGIYEGVFDKIDSKMDLPKTFEHYIISKISTKSNTQTAITLQNGDAFLTISPYQYGKTYVFTSPSSFESSNFLKHALFVPTIIRIAFLSVKPEQISYIASTNSPISLKIDNIVSETPIHIIKEDNSFDVIPENKKVNNEIVLFTQNQISQAGYYKVTQNNTAVKNISFNYNRKESDMIFLTNELLQKQIDDYGLINYKLISGNEETLINNLKDISENKNLWKLFLILALVFLMSEILIIRLLK
jgi:hypothetical protein